MLRQLGKSSTNLLKNTIFGGGGSSSSIRGLASSSSQSEFDQAQKLVSQLKEEPDNEIKLKLYALFKQASNGDAQGARPGMLDFVARAKFDAWNLLKGQTQETARTNYVKLVKSLVKEEASEATAGEEIVGIDKIDGLQVYRDGKIFKIVFNRPNKFNAFNFEMYEGVKQALNVANQDKSTTITVLTGKGNYFSSGNDLTNFKAAAGGTKEQIAKMAEESKVVLKNYVDAYINHEKPLIGLVNGPAIGIGVTVLGLFDYIVASDKATFSTPFAPLGQSPEGASSYTFPLIMGPLRAAELLLVCKKITAHKAAEYGLINEVVPHVEFDSYANKIAEQFASYPPESMRLNKKLLRSLHKEKLLEVNQTECDLLANRWQSKECHQAIAAFLTRSSKK